MHRIVKRNSMNWALEVYVSHPKKEGAKPYWNTSQPVGFYSTPELALKAFIRRGLAFEDGTDARELLGQLSTLMDDCEKHLILPSEA